MGVFALFFFSVMITQENIKKELLNWNQPTKFRQGFFYGATWANEQNAAEIAGLKEARDILVREIGAQRAELLKNIAELKMLFEQMIFDAKSLTGNFTIFPEERMAIARADELLKKYEQ